MTSLRYDAELPLAWSQVEAFEEAELRRLAHRNEQLMLLLPSLEAATETDEEQPDPRLQAIDFKLHLLIDMVGELLSRHDPLPPMLPVSLGSDDVRWRQTTPPQEDCQVLVDLYVNPRFPRSLKLPAKVNDVQATEGSYAVTAEFLSLGAAVQEQLERLLFRYHRRRIAEQRRGA